MLSGLHAFPLTPFVDDAPDEVSFGRLITQLAQADVDGITVLGSTGSYAYLNRDQRRRLIRTAVERCGTVPVAAGIGALSTSAVLEHLADAQDAGVQAVLLAPLTYQPLNDEEVFDLFAAVCSSSDVPVVVYDNPTTTGFTFSTELYGRLAQLPGISSIKIPPTGTDPVSAKARIDEVRRVLPAHVTIGISGDSSAATALNVGCEAWYSVIAGTLPQLASPIMRAAESGAEAEASAASARLQPLWELFAECGGSLRVVAAIAEHLGIVPQNCLPRPLHGLNTQQRGRVTQVLKDLGVTEG